MKCVYCNTDIINSKEGCPHCGRFIPSDYIASFIYGRRFQENATCMIYLTSKYIIIKKKSKGAYFGKTMASVAGGLVGSIVVDAVDKKASKNIGFYPLENISHAIFPYYNNYIKNNTAVKFVNKDGTDFILLFNMYGLKNVQGAQSFMTTLNTTGINIHNGYNNKYGETFCEHPFVDAETFGMYRADGTAAANSPVMPANNGYLTPPPVNGTVNSPVNNGIVNIPVNSGYAAPQSNKGYTNPPAGNSNVNAPVNNGYAAPQPNKGYTNPPAGNSNVNAPVYNGYANPQVNKGYVNPPVNNNYVNPPVNSGYVNSPVNKGYVNPPMNNNYVNPPVNSCYVNSPVNKGYVNPPMNNNYVNPPVNNGYANPPVNINYVKPPVNNSYANPYADRGYVIPPENKGYPNPPVNNGNGAGNNQVTKKISNIVTKKYCSRCGLPLTEEDKFCSNCGEKVLF